MNHRTKWETLRNTVNLTLGDVREFFIYGPQFMIHKG
jgi:hypothetical protein